MHRSVFMRALLPALPLVMVLGCATQRERRASFSDSRQRPTDDACEPRGRAPGPEHFWSCGYWHWDGVRYVWVEGRWRGPQ